MALLRVCDHLPLDHWTTRGPAMAVAPRYAWPWVRPRVADNGHWKGGQNWTGANTSSACLSTDLFDFPTVVKNSVLVCIFFFLFFTLFPFLGI